MKKCLSTVVLCLGVLFFLNAQSVHQGIHSDVRDARISINKEVVKKKAKKMLSNMCQYGYEIKWIELYKNSTYKVHFKTECQQSGELHYKAESGEFKKTILRVS
ncbi:MAG: hypothetical protein AAGG75_25310 [Bacteroidota bacterium]